MSRAPVIGAPAETPAPTERSSQFPAVGESTVRREGPAMTPEQKAKAEAEMVKRRSDAAAQRRKQIEQASPLQQ
ncbi:hypothetical protein [Variibacter gotjawalensis]|nr:hypothetical protein [Variibacter gotjawalensis]NIK46205.1 hypothetical protein [Variibacter gotjawalensis]